MTTYDHAGHEVHAEQELSREELGAYYDRRGWPWRRDDDDEPDHYTDDEEPDDRDQP